MVNRFWLCGLRAFVITPIAPHSLTNRAIVVGADVSVEFVVHGRMDELALLADGQERIDLAEGDRVEIEAAQGTVLLVSSGRLGPYGVMREKLGWGLGPALSRQRGARSTGHQGPETGGNADETV